MTLTGSLSEFALSDVFGLLAGTRKSGALHVRRHTGHAEVRGIAYLAAGDLTGASADLSRQALGRRLVGAGLVDDDALGEAIRRATHEPGVGLARALAETAAVAPDVLLAAVSDHVIDALFDLLRWSEGEFAFQVGETNVDDVGFVLPVDQALREARRRLDHWTDLSRAVPSQSSVVALALTPPGDLAITADEWALAALIDGRRTVDDLVALSGRGSFNVITALAAMSARGLVTVAPEGQDGTVADLQRRQSALHMLERPTPSSPLPVNVAVEIPVQESVEPVGFAEPEPAVELDDLDVIPAVAPPASPPTLAVVPDPDPDSIPDLAPEEVPAAQIDGTLLARLIDGVRAL